MPLRIWGKAPSLSFFEAGKVVCLQQSIHNFKTPDANFTPASAGAPWKGEMRRKFKQMNQCSTTTLLYYFVACGFLFFEPSHIYAYCWWWVWWYGFSTNRSGFNKSVVDSTIWEGILLIQQLSTLWGNFVTFHTFVITIYIEYYFEPAHAYTAQLITLLYFSRSRRFKSRSVQKKYFFCFSLLSSRIETIH